MATDPEYAAKIRAEWARANKRRYENETVEQREARLQHKRELSAEQYRKRKALEPPKPPKAPKPKAAPKAQHIAVKRPGRIMALAGWHRW